MSIIADITKGDIRMAALHLSMVGLSVQPCRFSTSTGVLLALISLHCCAGSSTSVKKDCRSRQNIWPLFQS